MNLDILSFLLGFVLNWIAEGCFLLFHWLRGVFFSGKGGKE